MPDQGIPILFYLQFTSLTDIIPNAYVNRKYTFASKNHNQTQLKPFQCKILT